MESSNLKVLCFFHGLHGYSETQRVIHREFTCTVWPLETMDTHNSNLPKEESFCV